MLSACRLLSLSTADISCCCSVHRVHNNRNEHPHNFFWCSPLAVLSLLPVSGGANAASSQNGSAGNYAGSAVEAGHAHEITSETPPASAPREYVVGLYNAYAETFDSHLQEALEYRTPAIIVESLAVLFPGRG